MMSHQSLFRGMCTQPNTYIYERFSNAIFNFSGNEYIFKHNGNNTANPDSVRSHVTANDVRPLLDQLLNTGAAAALPV